MDRPTVPLEFAEAFDAEFEPRTFAPAATLKEEDIPDEGLSRPYVQGVELGKIGEGKFGKGVENFSWDDQVTVPLEKSGCTSEEDRLAKGATRNAARVEDHGSGLILEFDENGKPFREIQKYAHGGQVVSELDKAGHVVRTFIDE